MELAASLLEVENPHPTIVADDNVDRLRVPRNDSRLVSHRQRIGDTKRRSGRFRFVEGDSDQGPREYLTCALELIGREDWSLLGRFSGLLATNGGAGRAQFGVLVDHRRGRYRGIS